MKSTRSCSEAAVLVGLGLFDLEHEPGTPGVGRPHQLGPGGGEILVGDGRADARARLDQDAVAVGGELPGPVGGEGDPVLSRLALGRHPDDHEFDATVGRPGTSLAVESLTDEAPVPIFPKAVQYSDLVFYISNAIR